MRNFTRSPPCPRGRSPPEDCCPWCYANRKGRGSYAGHMYYSLTRNHVKVFDWSEMKRPTSQATSPKGKWSSPDSEFKAKYPALSEGMCDCWWEDGKARVPWSLTVRFEGDQTHLCVNDKEGSMGLYTTAHTLPEALQQLEEVLKHGGAPWRRWKK